MKPSRGERAFILSARMRCVAAQIEAFRESVTEGFTAPLTLYEVRDRMIKHAEHFEGLRLELEKLLNENQSTQTLH